MIYYIYIYNVEMAYRPGVKIVKRPGRTLDKFEQLIQQVSVQL